MRNFKIVGSALLAGLLMFSGCGSSSGSDDNKTNPGGGDTPADPHPGETATQAKARYLTTVKKATFGDYNTSDPVVVANFEKVAECLYSKDKTLKKDDIVATLGSGLRKEDVNTTNSFTCSSMAIRKVGGTFTNSLNVVYYDVGNPVTGNHQLLAYNYDTDKAHVVNSNVILGNKTFLFSGEKDADKAKYTGRLHGIYLDPDQEFEVKSGNGRYGPYSYNFYSNNALMKFDATNPTVTESFFNSTQIPTSATGLTKLGGEYKVFENIVDPSNSYIGLKAFDSLADAVAGEQEDNKTQANITFRVGDKKTILGRPIAIVKKDDMKTDFVLISEAAPFKPADGDGTYALKKYNPTLTTKTDVADGEFYFATQNDTHMYLYKEGSNQIWALPKTGGALTAVTGVALAGNYDVNIHGIGAWHGQNTGIINGAASTISSKNGHLGKGNDAYLAFHYDLHPKAVTNAFGNSGVYKSAQIFKLTDTAGVKLMDNQDGVDQSMAAATAETIKGHVNLIAVTDDKLYVELGWWDGNDTVKGSAMKVGGDCNATYMSRGVAKRTCTNIKYGFLDTTVADAVDLTPLTNTGGDNIEATGLPYYVSRRIGPIALDGKLYISTFNGGSLRTGGYKFKKFVVDFSDDSVTEGAGRNYFTKTHTASNSGEYEGTVLTWDATVSELSTDAGLVLGDTSNIGGHSAEGSISGMTNGVPLAGIGTIGLLKNNDANHHFTLFIVDTEQAGIRTVDLAPYGGWIYD